jgi:hypothetical protein
VWWAFPPFGCPALLPLSQATLTGTLVQAHITAVVWMTFLPFKLLRHCCCALARIVRLVRLVRGFVKMAVTHWASIGMRLACLWMNFCWMAFALEDGNLLPRTRTIPAKQSQNV